MGNGKKSVNSNSSWYQGPKSRLEFANRGKEKESVDKMKTLLEFAIVPPAFKALGGLVKGVKRFSGLSNYLKSFVPGAKTVLTSSGRAKTVIGSQRTMQVGRVEDAYIGTTGHQWAEGSKPLGWFTRNLFKSGIGHYSKHVKDATKLIKEGSPGHYLPTGSKLRGIRLNLTPAAFNKFRQRLLNNPVARRRSGGVGRPTVQEEIIIPNAILDKVRKGDVPFAEVFFGRSSKDMMKQFIK